MTGKEYNERILQEIKLCIERLDIDLLWQLALTDPPAVFNKISTRMLGKRRMERLQAHLCAMNEKILNEKHCFELLLLRCIDRDLRAVLFTGKNI